MEKLTRKNKPRVTKVYAVTGTLHGSIIEAANANEAKELFSKHYKGEAITNVKKSSFAALWA